MEYAIVQIKNKKLSNTGESNPAKSKDQKTALMPNTHSDDKYNFMI
jgi:hypothetical protein